MEPEYELSMTNARSWSQKNSLSWFKSMYLYKHQGKRCNESRESSPASHAVPKAGEREAKVNSI